MFSRSISDYVIDADFTNHLQVKIGDTVTISEAAFVQLKRERTFWRNIAIGGTLTAVTCGLATGFVGVGIVGSELAVGLTAAEIAAVSGTAGGAVTAFMDQAITDAHIRRATLKTMPFIGKVTRIHKKNFSELHHVEVEFYIPSSKDTYTVHKQWVDAHHLMGLITVTENNRRTAEIQREAAEKQRKYDEELLKKHRTQFAPENDDLLDHVAELQEQLDAVKTQRTWASTALALAPFLLLL